MKFINKLGVSLICVGTGLIGINSKGHSNAHYIGSGSILGLGLGMLGSVFSKKPKIEINPGEDSRDDD